MKKTNKAKDNSPVMDEDFHHTIILSHLKSTASISGTFFAVSWFTYAIEQMDKPTALIKAVHSADYYRQ